jgi:hypothetical protein
MSHWRLAIYSFFLTETVFDEAFYFFIWLKHVHNFLNGVFIIASLNLSLGFICLFFGGYRELNSGPRACWTSTLPIETCPQPCFKSLIIFD